MNIHEIFSGFYPFKWGGKTVGDDEAILYTYNIDTLRADKFKSGFIIYK